MPLHVTLLINNHFFFYLAGKGSKGSLSSSTDNLGNGDSVIYPEDSQSSNGANGVNKKKKSILKKPDSRDKREGRSAAGASTGGGSSLSSSIVRSYYGSDPERENLLDSCSSDNVGIDSDPPTYKTSMVTSNQANTTITDQSSKAESTQKTLGNIIMSGTNNKVDVEKKEFEQRDLNKQPKEKKLTHEELKSLTGPKLKTGGGGKHYKDQTKGNVRIKPNNKTESMKPDQATAAAVSFTNPSSLKSLPSKQASKETAKTERIPLKINIKTEKQKNDLARHPIIISEDQSTVDEHLIDASYASKAHAGGKISNVGIRQETDSPPISSHVSTSLITSSIKSEQSMPVRSPSKLPPYKKPSSISATSNASGNIQASTTQATASTCNILPHSSSPLTMGSNQPSEVKVKTPLRIKRKVETTNTVNPSVPTVVTLNFSDQSKSKQKQRFSEKSGNDESNQINSLGKPSAKDIQQSISTIVTSTPSNNSMPDEKLNIGRHRVAPAMASKITLEPEETGDIKTQTEANGCPPLASSKEIQTSLLNISHKSPALSPSKKSDVTSSKSGRGKFERGHQMSRSPSGKNESDLETRKEVGKLIFKMGEELRDLSKKAITAQEAGDNEEGLNMLQPHCSNPLCRHNSPSTNTVVSVKPSTDQLICMCGRTMTLISRNTKDPSSKPDDQTIISDAS